MDHPQSDAEAVASAAAATELFALTDEQIVGIDSETAVAGQPDTSLSSSALSAQAESSERAPSLRSNRQSSTPTEGTQNGPAVPPWLAERMLDPLDGAAAKELWDGKQKADAELASYREAFATAADARALKEIYPGGLAEAKAAADRARELESIDAAFYRGDVAARAQLAQRMMQQDPAAFRAMVELGVKLLNEAPRNTAAASIRTNNSEHAEAPAQPAASIKPELVRAYSEFEKTANADLEKSVGGAITRLLAQALPNLRAAGANGTESPLGERLASAVREEVNAALRNDQGLAEQVARILAGHRFDDSSRAQVVRLIDTRAQQLLPGAVRRVVGSWTAATLEARGKRQSAPNDAPAAALSKQNENSQARRQAEMLEESVVRRSRLDYRRFSDEDILGL